MNYRKSLFRTGGLASVLLGLAALVSCTVDDKDETHKVELGAVEKEFVVEADAGSVDIEVYSNLRYSIEYLNEARWTELSDTTLSGDSKFTIGYEYNEEFPRMAVLRLVNDLDSRCDTVYLKQKGLLRPELSMPNTALISTGSGGEQLIDISTNIPMEDMTVEIVYPEGSDTDWITGVDIRSAEPAAAGKKETRAGGQKFVVNTEPNTDPEEPRTAAVTLSFVDGWGQEVALLVNVTQRNAREGLGRELTFEEARLNYGSEDGETINDFVCITGVVVSDKNSGNAGENPQTTVSSIDYNGSKTTFYLQSKDGRYGFCVQTATPEDNIFERYSEVQIQLRGAVMTAKENPERYTISGVTSAMVTSNVAGSASDVPAKERYMNQLTPDDLNTWVTLKDCEFPVRKGALVPTNEGYTNATNASRLSKYPLLIRDINGDAMYIYTNTTCVYRNDGTCLPYGSGEISGVLVHEKFTRFEYEDAEDEEDYGNIGDYQLRHMSKSDIRFEKSVEDSFSALLTEYRFQNSNYDGTAAPTYGTNGWLTHTYQEKYTHDKNKEYYATTYKVHFWSAGEFCYLGPVGNGVNPDYGKNTGNVNGCGIVLDLSKEHYNPNMEAWISRDGSKVEWAGPNATNAACKKINDTGGSNSGKGNVDGGCYTTFASNFWWDTEFDRPYGWMINFSTKGITTDQLSMQISVLNQDQNFYKPRFWKAEWSTVDSMDPEYDDQWHLIGEYTVPDLSIWSNTLMTTITAYKYINFRLPLEMLGRENVYVRLVPRNALASSGGGYADSFIYEGKPGAQSSVLSYFAVRYNK